MAAAATAYPGSNYDAGNLYGIYAYRAFVWVAHSLTDAAPLSRLVGQRQGVMDRARLHSSTVSWRLESLPHTVDAPTKSKKSMLSCYTFRKSNSREQQIMASVFKRTKKDGSKSAAWYVAYTDHERCRRMVKGFADRGLTIQLAGKLETEVMLRKRGMIRPEHDRIAEQRSKPLTDYLVEYENALKARQRTDRYISLTILRIQRILDGCGYTRLADLGGNRVESFLQALKVKEDFGNRTYNHYLQAFSSFCRWLIDKDRLTNNPVQRIPRLNSEVDVRHRRRALSADEIAKLVAAARGSKKRIQQYSGARRAQLYLLSYMTGLRRSELASLTPSSFNLNAPQPTLTVEAAFSKHR